MPLISVVLSVYKNVEEFEITLKTILSQTLKDFEVVVVDDGNSNHDRERLRRYCECDSRVVLIENASNKGLTKCLIQGIAESSGKYIARIDNGDLMVPRSRLEVQVKELSSEEIQIVGGEIEIVDVLNGLKFQSKISKVNSAPKANDRSNDKFYHVCVMFSRAVYDSVGGYNSNLKVGQDSDLWPRILSVCSGKNLPLVFAIAPMKQGSISVKDNNIQIKTKIARLKNDANSLLDCKNIFAVLFEYIKLALPVRLRVALRYFKNMKFSGVIGKHERSSLERIWATYSDE